MQSTASGPLERAEDETEQVTGRSLAQINNRLFEVAGTIFLSQVLHLQVSHLFYQSIIVEQKIPSRGEGFHLLLR
jgi:hypothetical protein